MTSLTICYEADRTCCKVTDNTVIEFRGRIMTIRETRCQNFRGFEGTEWLEISPITVLIGGNNSGKSGILHPLLILKQTLESQRAQSALVLRGKLINAGTFPDIVHGHDANKLCTFGIRFHRRKASDVTPQEPGDDAPASCEFMFGAEFVAMYASTVSFAESHITGDLSNVIYLGPLRDSPRQ